MGIFGRKSKMYLKDGIWMDEEGNIIIEDDEVKEMLIPDWYQHYFMR